MLVIVIDAEDKFDMNINEDQLIGMATVGDIVDWLAVRPT